jgi:hypothetical protein
MNNNSTQQGDANKQQECTTQQGKIDKQQEHIVRKH